MHLALILTFSFWKRCFNPFSITYRCCLLQAVLLCKFSKTTEIWIAWTVKKNVLKLLKMLLHGREFYHIFNKTYKNDFAMVLIMKLNIKLTWSSARASSEFCNWKRATLAVWGVLVDQCCTWVNSVPRWPWRPTIPWAASTIALLVSWGKWFSCSTLHLCDLTSI